jgi:hypothetical protein
MPHSRQVYQRIQVPNLAAQERFVEAKKARISERSGPSRLWMQKMDSFHPFLPCSFFKQRG